MGGKIIYGDDLDIIARLIAMVIARGRSSFRRVTQPPSMAIRTRAAVESGVAPSNSVSLPDIEADGDSRRILGRWGAITGIGGEVSLFQTFDQMIVGAIVIFEFSNTLKIPRR